MKRLGGSRNEKREEVLTDIKGTGHFCQMGHLHPILTFPVQKFPLIDSPRDDHAFNILFKLIKFTKDSYVNRNLDAFDSE